MTEGSNGRPDGQRLIVSSEFGIDEVLAVANTRHGPAGHLGARPSGEVDDHDHLRNADDARRFFATHGVPIPDVPPTELDLAGLRVIRDAARSLIDPGTAVLASPEIQGLFAERRFHLTPEHELEAAEEAWGGMISRLLPPLLALAAQRQQLKICANTQCGFLFADLSRNRSRIWCDMRICGNRAKGARYRQTAAAS